MSKHTRPHDRVHSSVSVSRANRSEKVRQTVRRSTVKMGFGLWRRRRLDRRTVASSCTIDALQTYDKYDSCTLAVLAQKVGNAPLNMRRGWTIGRDQSRCCDSTKQSCHRRHVPVRLCTSARFKEKKRQNPDGRFVRVDRLAELIAYRPWLRREVARRGGFQGSLALWSRASDDGRYSSVTLSVSMREALRAVVQPNVVDRPLFALFSRQANCSIGPTKTTLAAITRQAFQIFMLHDGG